MIRFSAALVVVAVGVLIGGIVTSTLTWVYVAIALSAAALIVLAIGVALKRNELFGEAEPRFPAGGAAGAASGHSAYPSQAYAGQPAASQGWPAPPAHGASPTYEGTGWTPPASGRGDVAETRTDIPPTAVGGGAGSGGTASGEARRADAPPADATRTDIPAVDATRSDIPAYPAQAPSDAPRTGNAPWGSTPGTGAPAGTGAPKADAPRSPASSGVTETRLDMKAIPADAPAGSGARPAPAADETRLDLPPTPAAPGAPAPGAPAAGAPGSGAPAAKPGSGTRQVAVVPGVPRFHALNCILVRFMDDSDLEKMTQDEANAAGYTPCAACQADTGSFKVAE